MTVRSCHHWYSLFPALVDIGLLLPTVPLIHRHIQFGHCYKGQEGWADYLSRFSKGGGILYDIEFLTDPSGKRVAAFGYYAGYAGAAVSLIAWAHQIRNPGVSCPSIPLYPSDTALVGDTRPALSAAIAQNNGEYPEVTVIGALGRCGTGAIDFCRAAGVPDAKIIRWDMAETARGGPFLELAACDIFINCIYLTAPIPPFITRESVCVPGRKLRVVCDVSCDPNDPKNPVPLYTECTTFSKPTIVVEGVTGDGPELTVTAIDHLPSLVAREASDAFSTALLPSLLALDKEGDERVWLRAEKLFHDHVKRIR